METCIKSSSPRHLDKLSPQAQPSIPTSIENPPMPAMIGIQDQLDAPFENMLAPPDPQFMSQPQVSQQMVLPVNTQTQFTFETDMQQFEDWIKNNPLSDNKKNIYSQKNLAYASVENGCIGSLYYGAGNQKVGNEIGLRDAPQQTRKSGRLLTPPNNEIVDRAPGVPQATGVPRKGARIRLLHSNGPQVNSLHPVERFVLTEQGRKPINPKNLEDTKGLTMLEWFYNSSGTWIARHCSRGSVEKSESINNLQPEDFIKLLQATMFAEKLAKNNFAQNPQPPDATSIDRANQFLYAYLQSQPRLSTIPLNMGTPGQWEFHRNFQYAPRGSLNDI